MTAERWQQIESLYHAALERPPGERGEYLTGQCDGDEKLRSEVESLLRNGDEAGFLDGRAVEIAARQYASIDAPDLTGRKLGRYEVISRLGAGGMGVVYRARDTRLKRDVALKVLPAASTADAERKRRFVQEARAASALNHPNIVSVYDIDELEGIDFITMECVPGKTLADVIGRKGLSVAEAVAYATQIASALAAAHAAGIVHRDLKPGNVMINADGQAKVLDFGLAKLAERFGDGKSTGSAWIAGTPAYMSPEQAEGKKVDARSDIFSFGAVLYEMLTGRAAFARDSTSSTVAAILRDDPEAIPELAAGLKRLINRCLQKDPNHRYQAMTDVKFAPEDLEQQSPAVMATVAKKPRQVFYVAVAVLTLAAAGVAAWFVFGSKGIRQPPQVTQVTFDGRLAINPAISADGKYVAYASDRAGEGNLDIWVHALPTGDPVRLTRDEANEDYPCFSADGTKIAYLSERDGGTIYVLPVLGGEPRLLAKSRKRPLYSPDGKYVLFSPFTYRSLGVVVTPADRDEPRTIQADPERSLFAVWSPDATRVLYAEYPELSPGLTRWRIVSRAGGAPIVSYQPNNGRYVGTPLAWLQNDRVLFSARSGDAVDLWQAKLSRSTWKAAEPSQRLTFGSGQINSASASKNGTVVFSSTIAPTRIWSFPLQNIGRPSEGNLLAFPSSGGLDYFPSLSDNGKMAYVSQKAGKWNVWVRDLTNGKETWLASVQGSNPYLISTVIKSDGSRVAYSNCGDWTTCSIFTVAAAGGVPQRVCDHCGQVRAWPSDGSQMASSEPLVIRGTTSGFQVDRINPVSGRKAVIAEKQGTYLYSPSLSRDGHWIAFQARETDGLGFEQLFIARLDGGEPIEPTRWIAVTGLDYFDAGPMWSRDGNTLYFTSNRDGSTCLWAVRLDSETKKPISEPFAIRHFHASPRQYSDDVYPVFSLGSDRIVINLEQVQSDLWMMQLPE